jgi:hypothetical protein
VSTALRKTYHDFDRATVNQLVTDLDQFIVVHELAHVVVQQLHLKDPKGDEDAAGKISIVLLTKLGTAGGGAAFGIADLFDPAGRPVKAITSLPYWKQHSLDGVRAHDFICWIYGSDIQVYADLALAFPKPSADRCKKAYVTEIGPWLTKLGPYLKA